MAGVRESKNRNLKYDDCIALGTKEKGFFDFFDGLLHPSDKMDLFSETSKQMQT
jgi:hypothetical protein